MLFQITLYNLHNRKPPDKLITEAKKLGRQLDTKLFISVGSTNPDPLSEAFEAGVVAGDPLTPPIDFHYMWWKELLDM